jgi:hypothetical protein
MNRRDFLALSSMGIGSLGINGLQADELEKLADTNSDIYLDSSFAPVFNSVRRKLRATQSYIGYGNFNIVAFDDVVKIARRTSRIGKFTKDELFFLESIFYYDPSSHGFYGRQISREITERINRKEVYKVPYTGHYLFKGKPLDTYNEMVGDIGKTLTLTSGIRSIVKQTKLFLDKVNSVDGNITVASKSLAPPAFTYHAIGDFDVGKKGFGHANFTERFALTEEFIKIRKLKYVDVRYTVNNKDGVRYEPWHITTI